jgi:CHAT domain
VEAIDAGDVPLDDVVRQLFSETGLRELIGHHGVACFVLARSALAPQFYEQLITNIDTIDTTTRHHIAFIVFHGNQSSIVRRSGYDQRDYKHHVIGLSVSDHRMVRLDDHGRGIEKMRFNRDLIDRIKQAPHAAPLNAISRAMELAATMLMGRFGIRETVLPCLLFVDGRRLNEPQVVRLSPEQPMSSLYRDVLAPLSDEFRSLEAYWRRRDQIVAYPREHAAALEAVAAFPEKLATLDKSLDRVNSELAKQLGVQSSEMSDLVHERDALNIFCRAYKAAQNLDEKVALMPSTARQYAEAHEVRKRLAALEAEKKRAYSPALTREQRQPLAELSFSVNQLRRELSALAQVPYSNAKQKLSKVEAAIAPYERRSKEFRLTKQSIINQIERLNQGKQAAERTINRLGESDLEAEQLRADEAYDTLRRSGYGDEVLRDANPSAIDVVKTLVERDRIGVLASRRTDTSSKRLKILFLAANPLTPQLDLEEELRAIENELRGTLYRDNIDLVARHAVRPDDLVRCVRADAPDVVHFSGHGTSEGIVLRDDAGGYRIVRGEALSRLMKDRGVKLVVLNACFSTDQADSLSAAVDTVVGTTREVGDEAARRFSIAFYRTLGEGHTVGDAFRDGGDSLNLHNLKDVYRIVGQTDYSFVNT